MKRGYINIVRNIKNKPVSFDPAFRPANDSQRILALRRFKIFNTPSEEIFSAYTELAALTFKTPIALMSFVDEEQVFYKESYGVSRTGQVVSRKNSPCTLAILNAEVTVFRYALTDPCVLADEKNREGAGYKFYAGAPLVTTDGFNIGMLAVVDRKPREYSDDELDRLQELSREVMTEIEFRSAVTTNLSIPQLNNRLNRLHSRVEALRH